MARRIPKSAAFSKVPGPSAAQENSRFLNIPPEIRNRIYAFVFNSQKRIWPSKRRAAARNVPARETPGIVLACRQTHAEATPTYYSETIFSFGYSSRFRQWHRAIGHERAKMLRDVRIMPPTPPRWNNQLFDKGRYQPEAALRDCAKILQDMLDDLLDLSESVKPGVIKTEVPNGDLFRLIWTSTPRETIERVIEDIPKVTHAQLIRSVGLLSINYQIDY